MGNVHDDALITLTLFLVFASIAYFNVVKADVCYHDILVQTGNVKNAGTDAVVTLKLYDAQGHMIESTNLEEEGRMVGEERGINVNFKREYHHEAYDYFERDHLDSFMISSKCHTSKLCKLELSHDNTGKRPGWYVDYVRVQTKYPGELIAFEDTKFEINQWLARSEKPNLLSVQKNLC